MREHEATESKVDMIKDVVKGWVEKFKHTDEEKKGSEENDDEVVIGS